MKAARQPKPSKGRIARPVATSEPTARKLGHWLSLHERVEAHDLAWYQAGGRHFRTLAGRELATLADIEQAIATDGLVESQ